eukprot:3435405-Heterocapsa_arctica.AAC.1
MKKGLSNLKDNALAMKTSSEARRSLSYGSWPEERLLSRRRESKRLCVNKHAVFLYASACAPPMFCCPLSSTARPLA